MRTWPLSTSHHALAYSGDTALNLGEWLAVFLVPELHIIKTGPGFGSLTLVLHEQLCFRKAS